MSAKDPLDIHHPQFDLSKCQVAHDLALVVLNKKITGKEHSDKVYDLYLGLLKDFSITIDDRTRYEKQKRKWREEVPVGQSVFDARELPR